MDIKRNIEICSTQFLKKIWKLSIYSKEIEKNNNFESCWKELADSLYLIPNNEHVIEFDEIAELVFSKTEAFDKELTKLFSSESDFSGSCLYYGSSLFLRDLRRNIFEVDLCKDEYNGCSEVISSLLSYYLGKKSNEYADRNSINFIKKIEMSSNYVFFYGYTIPDTILKEIVNTTINFERMIPKDRWNSAKSFMDEFDKKSDFEILQNYGQYSPRYTYFAIFYEWEFAVPSILEGGNYKLILLLLNKLKYPFFQNEILSHLTKGDCVNLCKEIIDQNPPKGKILAALLLEQWLDSIIKFGELIDDYANQDLDSELQKEVDAAKKRRVDYLQNLAIDLSIFEKILGLPFVVKFAFTQKFDESQRETSHKKNNNEVLSLLQNKLLEHEDFNKVPFSDLDVLCLFSLIQKKYNDNNIKDVQSIMNVLNTKILSANIFTSLDLSEKNITLMRKYCLGLLNLSTKDILLHIENYRTFFEGYNTLYEKNYENIGREIFILCSVILLFEHEDYFDSDTNEKQKFFHSLTSYILSQIYRCPNEYFVEHYYLISLQLIKIVVEQIYIDGKKWFDEQILNLKSIKMILLIFQYNQTDLSESTKYALKQRLKNEWNSEKTMFLKKQNALIKKLDDLAKRLTN